MRILIFHGYLLSGTGSNVYNARLAEALVRLGHEVHLFSQDRHPERHGFVDAAGNWDGGALELTDLGSRPVRCTVYRPDIGGLLPVYVQDTYEGIEARTFARCSDTEVSAYIEANVRAVREVVERVRPDVALANHLVMGPVILARALSSETPYAVKVHGSALEYTVKPEPDRFLGHASEGLASAASVLVGSRHTAESLWEALGGPEGEAVKGRTRLGPPGVDVERFSPHDRHDTELAIQGLRDRLRAAPSVTGEQSSAFARDNTQAADALTEIVEGSGPLVAFVGKLIVSKGVDLLIAAWPLLLTVLPDARLVVIGFGAYREALERLVALLAGGDLEGARQIARAGRALETDAAGLLGSSPLPGAPGDGFASPQPPLRLLLAFFDSLNTAEEDSYLRAARGLAEQVVFTGRLDHEELVDVLPACEALVVPSTFPEAFGMVAAEAAACGVFPVSARHSGLAEVSEAIAGEVPEQAAGWLSFGVDDSSVRALAGCLLGWLGADAELKRRTRSALVAVVRERWSWEGVARGVIEAANGTPVARPFG
ncbi:MAG TPA: glycosyltransferase family 4 protein [Solirubrobacteraceae bacterium]